VRPPEDPEVLVQESEVVEIAGSGSIGSSSLLSAALLGSSATIIVALLGVGRTKALALGLEPSGLGLYGQILALLTALSAASGLGLGLGTTRLVAAARARGNKEELREALEVSFALPLAVASAMALGIAALSGILAPLLLDDDRALLIVLAALVVPIVALQGPLLHALQGFRDVAGAQGSNVFFGLILTIASVVGVVLAGLEGAVVALAVGNLAYAGALAWRLRGLLRRVGVRLALRAGLSPDRLRQPQIRAMLGIGFASLTVGVAATVGEIAVRTFVLQGEGAEAAGIFQALMLISVQVLGVVVASVVFLSFTAISEAHAAGDRERARRTVDDTLRLTLLLLLPVLIALWLFRDEAIRLLLSSEFAEAGDLLPRQLVGDALRTAGFALGAALVPLGMTRIWFAVSLASVAAYVGVAAWLVPADGLDGAVNAYIAQWAVALALIVVVLLQRGYLAPSRLTVRLLAWGLVATVLLAGASLPLPYAALAAIVFAGGVLLVGTARDERMALAVRVRAVLGR
jgi:O-antigen/teichoic acid export membrane protein